VFVPQAVIFDMDGVLVDSGGPHLESWQLLAREHGLDVSPETFTRTFGMRSRDIIRTIWGENTTDDDIRRLVDRKEVLYRELITGRVPLCAGVRETLTALAAGGLVLAVGTSGPPENLELVLREAGLGAFFAATVSGTDVRHGKPAPDVFLLAAERLGVPPAQCVVVEDAPVGIAAARAAGMAVIAYAGTHPVATLVEAGAGRVVHALMEITAGLVGEMVGAGG
jgi:beta-phosphoglucomutase family hydrolase